jgi:peptide/nickel transport system substrate-binding protein
VQIALKRDEIYFKGPAPVATIIVREVPSSANRLALLKGGAVDVVAYLQPRERLSLKGDPNVKVVSFAPAQTHSILYMTTTKKPFDNPLVRQAVCYALPYEKIVATVGLGTARRQNSPLPANYQYYAPGLNPYDLNVAKAKALLAQAGFPTGCSTSIGFSNDDPTVEQQAAMVQNALSAIGIKASLLKQPFATYSQNWLGLKYDMGMMYEGAFIPDFTYALNLWYFGPKSKNFLNFTNYYNQKVNNALNQARSTFAPAKREQLAKLVQGQIMQDAPMCYLVEPGVHLPSRKNIGGISYWTYSAQHFDLWTKR